MLRDVHLFGIFSLVTWNQFKKMFKSLIYKIKEALTFKAKRCVLFFQSVP